ncbi:MAG: NlpC/P60 family protein [Gammaproteobacteria bacterium]|nr:NlpC/P60 family protein [Gammaproteobacteria bacterium]
MLIKSWMIILFCGMTFTCNAASDIKPAVTQPIPINDLVGFKTDSVPVKNLIRKSYALSAKNLTYLYGSANPSNKGMDCSGTIYYLLKSAGVSDVPRQANEMYAWVEHDGNLSKVSNQSADSLELKNLKPGDLLFWKGTYAVKRDPQITHVMLYLGKNTKNQPLMFGSSDGRSYQGKKMWGVSVFDFKLSNDHGGKFVAYGCIPHLTCETSKQPFYLDNS